MQLHACVTDNIWIQIFVAIGRFSTSDNAVWAGIIYVTWNRS